MGSCIKRQPSIKRARESKKSCWHLTAKSCWRPVPAGEEGSATLLHLPLQTSLSAATLKNDTLTPHEACWLFSNEACKPSPRGINQHVFVGNLQLKICCFTLQFTPDTCRDSWGRILFYPIVPSTESQNSALTHLF